MLDLGYEETSLLQKDGADGVIMHWNSMAGTNVPANDPFRVAECEILGSVDPHVHRWVTRQNRILCQEDFLAQDPATYTAFLHLPRDFGQSKWRTKVSIPHGADQRGLSIGATSMASFDVLQSGLDDLQFLAHLYCSLHTSTVPQEAPSNDALPAMNAKQVECLRWAAAGKTYADIAEIVGISERTVRYHLDCARNRYGFATTIQTIVQAAKEFGFDPLDPR